MTAPATRSGDRIPDLAPLAGPIIGVGPAIRKAVALAQRFAASSLSILLVGETGTGKELFAEEIHRWSGRRGALVDVDCGALPREMVESILFGHRRGAFTGATESAEGLVTASDRGTLFLDEVTSLSGESQAKLLRVLETAEVRPLGGAKKHRVDLRVIAAGQLSTKAPAGVDALRLDLYQRLAGVVIELPPLRDRPEDIGPLAEHFAGRHGLRLGSGVGRLLEGHRWTANIRELRQAIERAVILSTGETLGLQVVRESIRMGRTVGRGQVDWEATAEARAALQAQLDEFDWDVVRLASFQGVSRATIYRRIQTLGLARPRRSAGKGSSHVRLETT